MIKCRRDDFSFFHFYQKEWNCPPCLFDGCDDNWVFLDIVAQSELPVIKECLRLGHYEHCVDLHNGAKKIMKSYSIFFVFIKKFSGSQLSIYSQVSIKRAARLTTYICSWASCSLNRDLRVHSPSLAKQLEWFLYINGPPKLDALISIKQLSGLKLCL